MGPAMKDTMAQGTTALDFLVVLVAIAVVFVGLGMLVMAIEWAERRYQRRTR